MCYTYVSVKPRIEEENKMKDEILLIAQFEIEKEKIDEYKDLYNRGIETILQGEPDVLNFKLYLNQDETVLSSLEVYRNSEAISKHFEYSSERIGKILKICQVTNLAVYGNVSDEIKELLSPYDTKFFKYCVGYER